MSINFIYKANAILIPAIVLTLLSITFEVVIFQTYKSVVGFSFSFIEFIIWLVIFYICSIPLFISYKNCLFTFNNALLLSIVSMTIYLVIVFYPKYSIDHIEISVIYWHIDKLCSFIFISYWLALKQRKKLVPIST